MYEESICAGMESYAKDFVRKTEDLIDEEIGFVMEKVSGVLNEELIKVMMLGRRVPEVYEASREIRTYLYLDNLVEC